MIVIKNLTMKSLRLAYTTRIMYVDFEISHIIWWHNGGFEGVLAIFFMPELVALCICWRVTHAAYRDTPEPEIWKLDGFSELSSRQITFSRSSTWEAEKRLPVQSGSFAIALSQKRTYIYSFTNRVRDTAPGRFLVWIPHIGWADGQTNRRPTITL